MILKIIGFALMFPLFFSDISFGVEQPSLPELVEAQVTFFDDADTFKVRLTSGITSQIRLACVDAPELPHTKIAINTNNSALINHYQWGKKALDFVKSLIAIKSNIKIKPTSIDYRYGRTVAQIFLPDGRNLAELLVGEGLAQNYDAYINQCSDKDQLIKAQETAKSSLKGIWGDSSYIPPSLARKLALIKTVVVGLPESSVSSKPIAALPDVTITTPSSSFDTESQAQVLPPCTATDCNCKNFSTQEDAQLVFDAYPDDRFRLDRDHDGIACERLSKK